MEHEFYGVQGDVGTSCLKDSRAGRETQPTIPLPTGEHQAVGREAEALAKLSGSQLQER